PEPTATATPVPTAVPPEPTPTVQEGVIEIEAIRYEDDLIELRIGPEPRFGYEANARIKSNEGGGWIIQLDVGDTLIVGEIEQSSSRSTLPHAFTAADLGVRFPLDAVEGGGTVSGWKFTFYDEGVYPIGDAHEHGKAFILVGDVEIGGYLPVTYLLDEIRVRDTVFELRMGDTIAWGYGDDPRSAESDRIRTDEVGDIIITINLGDSLVFPDGLTGSNSSNETHFITIDELGINAEIAPGADTNLDLVMQPTETGTFRLYCSAHPDPSVHGNFFIVVNEPPAGAPEPVVYTLDQIRLRDAAIELRIGEADALGFPAGERVTSADGNVVTITVNAGDSLVFPSGFTGSSSNTSTHFLTIDELGIDIAVEIGNRETALGFVIELTEPGSYRVYCSAHPDDHGSFTIVAEAVASGAPAPVNYVLQRVRVRDELMDFRMGDTTAWGYQSGMRVESGPGHDTHPGQDGVFLTINLGDSISFEQGIDGSNGNTTTHFFTIDELGINIELPPNGTDQAGEGFTIKPTELGNHRVYCSAHPDDHGIIYIIVVDPALAAPAQVSYPLQMVRVRDDIMDVRMGDTTAWGYDAGMRVESGPGHDTDPGQKIVLLTINLGDSISFERGINGSNSNADTHFFTIDGLGIDIELPADGTDQAGEGFTITPTESGNYRIYCSAHPDRNPDDGLRTRNHGDLFIIVR
ncbi:MAG: hypothetical protein J4N32_02785, partial [Chloroflexi bacterium]|nr:hypothetical protein [Chloroflexota bacterium]